MCLVLLIYIMRVKNHSFILIIYFIYYITSIYFQIININIKKGLNQLLKGYDYNIIVHIKC